MANAQFPSKILIVDHDQSVVNQVEAMLSSRQIPVVKATSFEQALYHFNQNKIDLCIIEKELEGIHGSILIQKFRAHEIASKRNPGFILTSNSKTDQDQHILKELGGICVLSKPIKEPSLLSMLVKAMDEANNRKMLHELKITVIDPLLKSGNHEKALIIADTKLMGGGKKAQFMASEINEESLRYQNALDITTKLYKDDARNLQYVNQLGRLNMKMGKLEDAKKFYESADELAPDHLTRLQEMADLYLTLQLPEKSIDKYTRLIKNNPEDPELKFKFFEDLQKAGFAQEAKDFCKQTTGAMELIRHFNNRGVLFSKEKMFLEAIDEYAKARRLIPESKELYRVLYNMAIAHINLKSQDHLLKAEKLLKETLKIKPDFIKANEKLDLIAKYIHRSA